MPSMLLTDAAIKKLKPPPTGQRDYFDRRTAGLVLRVSYSGLRGFSFRYKLDGRQRRLSIGDYPAVTLADAREAAAKYAKALARGDDPALLAHDERHAAKQRRQRTFENTAADYVAHLKKAKRRSWAKVERNIERLVAPEWGKLPIEKIRRSDCIELIEGIADKSGRFMAQQTRANVRALFGWACKRDLLEVNPMAYVERPISPKDAERDRVLNDNEIKAIWKAATATPYPFGPFVQVLFLTAQRRTEVARMRWTDLDLAAGLWRLSREETKAGRAHDVPLSAATIAILRELPRFVQGDFVFSTTGGQKPIGWFGGPKLKLDAASGVKGWRLHDIRRTAATRMSGDLRVPSFDVSRVLNHAQQGVIRVYDRAKHEGAKRAALDAWATLLTRIVTGTSKHARFN